MQVSLQEYDEIQRYLDGEMTAVEMLIFLADVDVKSYIKEALEVEQLLRNMPSSPSRQAQLQYIKGLIGQAGEDWKPKQKGGKVEQISLAANGRRKNRISFIKMFAVAATVAAAVVGVYFVVKKQHNANPPIAWPAAAKDTTSGLAQKRNPGQVFPIPVAPSDTAARINAAQLADKLYARDTIADRGNAAMDNSITGKLRNMYIAKNYNSLQEISLGEIAGAELPATKDAVHYYKGLSYFETGDYVKASNNLQWVVDSSQNSQLVEKAQWYAVLALIKTKNNDKATQLLTAIGYNTNNPYNNQAKQLLKGLKK